jgi:hypothetical protein
VDSGEERHKYHGATIGTSQSSQGRQAATPRVMRVLTEALGWRHGFGIARLPLDVEMKQYCVRREDSKNVAEWYEHGMRTSK